MTDCEHCAELEARIKQLYAECSRLEMQSDGYKQQYHELYRRFETLRYLDPDAARRIAP